MPAIVGAQASGAVFLAGYGALTIAAFGRVIRGNGEADLRPGSRVRIRLATRTLEGTFASLSPDSLVIGTANGEQVIANAEPSEISVSVGQRSRWAQGYVCGLAVGGIGGAALGFASGDDPPGFFSFTAGQKAVIMGVGLGVIGSLAGTLIGAANPG